MNACFWTFSAKTFNWFATICHCRTGFGKIEMLYIIYLYIDFNGQSGSCIQKDEENTPHHNKHTKQFGTNVWHRFQKYARLYNSPKEIE